MTRFESIIINGKSFELDTKEAGVNPNMVIRDIRDVCGRPSETKVAIWEKWVTWFVSNDGACTISSYNSYFFSIHGVVHDYVSDEWYECFITAGHNRCKLIKELS